MTPPAAAAATAAARHAARRNAAPARRGAPPPRRVSGPSGGLRALRAVAGGAIAAPRPAGLPRRGAAPVRVPARGRRAAAVRALHAVPDARFLDRLLRGRAWIALIAIGLMGIVFLQVSLLRLNTGIGVSVQRSSALERQNDALRTEISRLGGGERIQDVAADAGMVMPAPGAVRFLDARHASAARAARNLHAPDPVVQQPASALTGTTAALTAASPVAATSTPATSAPATTTGQTATATPATSAPATTAPATSAAAPAVATPAPAPTTPTQTTSPSPTGGAPVTPTAAP